MVLSMALCRQVVNAAVRAARLQRILHHISAMREHFLNQHI
jgi:hypothetical protein